MNIKWDADKYTKDFSFVHQYGNGVVELIDCEIGGTLIDLGVWKRCFDESPAGKRVPGDRYGQLGGTVGDSKGEVPGYTVHPGGCN